MTQIEKKKKSRHRRDKKVTLKTIAEHLGLTPGTVSAALNNSAASRSIPEQTKNRIALAAKELNYEPNFFARSLRLKRTFTIGVIAEEIGDAYGSMIISGIEQYLRAKDYFFLTVIHRHDPKLLQTYSQMLVSRGVEGFITVDTSISEAPPLPTVAVAGHLPVGGVTNIVLDHKRAALLALSHLQKLGHKKIAFLKGQSLSSDSLVRWQSICEVGRELGIHIDPELTVQIEGVDSTPSLGYPFAKQLLARKRAFTALFAYNDISAIGSMQAFHEAGLRVPEDISLVGFDDIPAANFANPGLTTVRQPLLKMGQIAAQTIVDQIEGRVEFTPEIAVDPELIIRATTAPPRKH
ncbi:MAG: substrate-binding domain-containing protein [Candidatus Acidiferrum sp.]